MPGADARLRIQIEARNRSQSGFQSASASLKSFDKQIKSIDKQLTALDKRLKGLGGRGGGLAIKIDERALVRAGTAAGRAMGRAAAAELQRATSRINASVTGVVTGGGGGGALGGAALGAVALRGKGASSKGGIFTKTANTFVADIKSAYGSLTSNFRAARQSFRAAGSSLSAGGRVLTRNLGDLRLDKTERAVFGRAEAANLRNMRLGERFASTGDFVRQSITPLKHAFTSVGKGIVSGGKGLTVGLAKASAGIVKGLYAVGKTIVNAARKAFSFVGGLAKKGIVAGGALAGLGFVAGERVAGVENAEAAFSSFTGRIGENIGILQKLQKVSDGTVSKLDLMSASIKAISLGAVKNGEELTNLIDLGAKLGRISGQGAAKGVEDLTIGLARQSKLILDNLGIIIDLDTAYEDYAKSIGKTVDQLTEADKKQAFVNAGLEKARDLVKGSTSDVNGFAVAWEQMKAALDDAWTTIAQSLAPALRDAAEGIRDWGRAIADIEPNMKNLEAIFEATIELITNLFINALPTFWDVGLTIGKAIARGIGAALAGGGLNGSGKDILTNLQDNPVFGGVKIRTLFGDKIGNQFVDLADRRTEIELLIKQIERKLDVGGRTEEKTEDLRVQLRKARYELIRINREAEALFSELTAPQVDGAAQKDPLAIFKYRLSQLQRRVPREGEQGFIGPLRQPNLNTGIFAGGNANATKALDGAAALLAKGALMRVAALMTGIFGPGVTRKGTASTEPGEIPTLTGSFFGTPYTTKAPKGKPFPGDIFGLGMVATFIDHLDDLKLAMLQAALAGDKFTNTMDEIFEFYSKQLTDMGLLAETLVESFGNGVENGFRQIFDSIIDGTFEVGDAINNLLNAILRSFLDATTSAIGSGAKALFASLLGSANGNVLKGGFQKFANGGTVTSPTLGLVGEGRFNEAIVPLPDGRSIPVDMRGGSGSTYNITIQALDSKSFEAALADNSRAVMSVVERSVGTSQRSRRSIRGR